VIAIGLDGLEPSLVEPMLAVGELPSLARIASRGGYARLGTTSPAQTPVAWSTFATGLNPGGHGIFDFLSRDPRNYLPDLALSRFDQKNAFTPPRAVNRRRGEGIWTILTRAGVSCSILRCPCTFPPDRLLGQMLSGMGVPDIRGGLGTGTFFTTAPSSASVGEGEQIAQLERIDRHRLTSRLIGPRSPRDSSGMTLPLELTTDPANQAAILRCTNAQPEELTVRVGAWSDWLRVRFKVGLLQSFRGMVRFLLRRLEPEVELYASPVNFDPWGPVFPISEPPEFSRELADDLGPYYTTGMAEDHAALMNGRIDEHAFLDQCAELWNEREAMLSRALHQTQDGLIYCLFDTPDRVQHLFWRYLEPDHPANQGAVPAGEFRDTIAAQYRRADAAVGAALDAADDQTLFIALSDHGFGSFRRCVELNTWLKEQGLLNLTGELGPGDPPSHLLRGIDWEHTSAYAVGLGGIYLNLQGREGRGIVTPAGVHSLESNIMQELTALEDPKTGHRPVREVRRRAELYTGPCAAESPDLMVHLDRGYRVGWTSGLGGVAAHVFADNTKRWSGDHIFDPALVPGVLFMNRPFRTGGCDMRDLAPSILAALGVEAPATLEGSSLLS
jgi:predicted AlkP superfamily phosphohydrolase/phosphomutase